MSQRFQYDTNRVPVSFDPEVGDNQTERGVLKPFEGRTDFRMNFAIDVYGMTYGTTDNFRHLMT